MIQPLTVLDGVVAALPFANVDTDMILPSRFLKTIRRSGLGTALFHGLRYDAQERELPDFALNRAPWRDAKFLVAHDNFGCGSSREHAVWALLDFGIKCVIAPRFADIFSNNAGKNGVLTITLEDAVCEWLIVEASSPATARLHLDLPAQTLTSAGGEVIAFDISAERKRRIVEGLDDIQETLRHEVEIASHEAQVCYPRPSLPRGPGLFSGEPVRRNHEAGRALPYLP